MALTLRQAKDGVKQVELKFKSRELNYFEAVEAIKEFGWTEQDAADWLNIWVEDMSSIDS